MSGSTHIQTQSGNPGYDDNALFVWVENLPRPAQRTRRPMEKEQLQQLFSAALAAPYRGKWNATTQQYEMDDPLFDGATQGEVMVQRIVNRAVVDGDAGAAREILDRILGKPKQAIEAKISTMSYTEYLEASVRQNLTDAAVGALDVPAHDTTAEAEYLDHVLDGL